MACLLARPYNCTSHGPGAHVGHAVLWSHCQRLGEQSRNGEHRSQVRLPAPPRKRRHVHVTHMTQTCDRVGPTQPTVLQSNTESISGNSRNDGIVRQSANPHTHTPTHPHHTAHRTPHTPYHTTTPHTPHHTPHTAHTTHHTHTQTHSAVPRLVIQRCRAWQGLGGNGRSTVVQDGQYSTAAVVLVAPQEVSEQAQRTVHVRVHLRDIVSLHSHRTQTHASRRSGLSHHWTALG